jgi:hypothetical protein
MTLITPTAPDPSFSTVIDERSKSSAPIPDVDRDAPVVASAEVEVLALPESVFAVLTDVASWPRWNPDVRAASIEGPFDVGTRFRWKAGPSMITSILEHVEPPRRIVWRGKSLGIRAIHVYELIPRGERTLVMTRESWDGILVRLLRKGLGRTLQKSLEAGLRYLEMETERSRR